MKAAAPGSPARTATTDGIEIDLGKLGRYDVCMLKGSDHGRHVRLNYSGAGMAESTEFDLDLFLELVEEPLVEPFRALAECHADHIRNLDGQLDDLEYEIDGLEEKVRSVEKERDEAKTTWIRARADLDNNQRRARKDQEIARMELVRSVSKDLVDVLDNLTLVLGTKDAATGEPVYREGSGIMIVRDQFVEVLTRRGVKPLDVKPGAKFDPTRHEVVLAEDQRFGWSDCGADQVCEVVFDGYSLGETILRPARVRIRKVSPPAPAPAPAPPAS